MRGLVRRWASALAGTPLDADVDGSLEPFDGAAGRSGARQPRRSRGGATSLLVDAGTWTFWSKGALSAETLVETAAGEQPATPAHRRVAELIAEQERRATPVAEISGRAVDPRTDPAYGEIFFVELMRARRYQRAFSLLAPECQRSWGSPEAFAEGQSSESLEALAGVDVRDVRRLRRWTDPETGRAYENVAELVVEYAVRSGERTVRLRHTVHLVSVEGQWRSLSYPPRSPAPAARTAGSATR